MASPQDIRRYRANWQGEVDGAAVYQALAEAEHDPRLAKVYANLSQMESTHAGFWERQLQQAGQAVGARRPGWRSRVHAWLARRFGPELVVPTVAALERANQDEYASQPETQSTRMTADEHWHATVLDQVLANQHTGVAGPFLGRLEGRHHGVGGNALRAAVLGANDGLCSNLSLMMGVAGAAVSSHAVLLTGLAGLLAGAGSMALGEWVSVTSSRELAQGELATESDELTADPEGEREELRLIYEAKGLSEADAEKLSRQLLASRATAMDVLAREELGIDPASLGGSAWVAGGTSFLLFAVGAAVPVLPYLFAQGLQATGLCVAASGLGLFGIGAAITLFTGRPVWISGGRQLLLGLGAAAITFGLGRLVGAVLG